MMRHLHRPLAALLLGAALPAQEQKLEARSFLPQHYQAEFLADLEAMRECEFLDGLERSMPLRMLKSLLRNETGIDVESLHRVRIASQDRGDGDELQLERVTVLEGSAELGLPDPTDARPRSEFAGHAVLREQRFAVDTIWVSPRPGLLVIGSPTAVEPRLKGERRGGVPHPDLMPIIAVREPLLHFAATRSGMEYGQWVKLMGFPKDWVTSDDPIETAVLRLEFADEAVVATAELRFASGEKGPALFASRIREVFAEIKGQPGLAAAAAVLEKVAFAESESTLKMTLDLGSPREASAQVAQMLAPMAFMVGTAEAAPAVIEVEAEAEAPVPKPAAGEKPGKRKGEKKK